MYQIVGWAIAAAVGAVFGGAVVYFWDDLKAWATRMIGYILDAINWAIEIASDAITYIATKVGTYYRQVKVWIKNRHTGAVKVVTKEEPINDPTKIPADIRRQLGMNDDMEVARTAVRR